MPTSNHQDRVNSQIRQYAAVENMHGQLGDIFFYWQKKYFKPRFDELFNVSNHFEFYAKPFAKRIARTGVRDLISFGCGDAQVEIGVAKYLRKLGTSDFLLHCVELSPFQLERAKANAEAAGLSANFRFIEADFNIWRADGKVFAGAMCHHVLHHVQELEHFVGSVRDALHPGGVFASIDVIGRNGHMRWPEALELVEHIWRFLPDDKKYHHLLKAVEPHFQNRDCSTRGFEGIRSQDILPILMQNFRFEAFLGFGNLIDVFTSRGFGPNFNAEDEHDQAFVDFIEFLNELLLDLGYLKPTRMCAVMVRDEMVDTRVYKHRTPEFCVRLPDAAPAGTAR